MAAGQKHPEEIFTELVTEHQARIYGCVYAMVQQSADAEDIVQRTLITLWRQFDKFEQGTDFCAWAITTARYEVRNFQRSSRQPNPLADELLSRLVDRAVAIVIDDSDGPRREALYACVDDLSPEDRHLLEQRYAEDQKLKEMAAQLNRSEQSLSNSLTRIRHWLFECITRRIAQEDRQ